MRAGIKSLRFQNFKVGKTKSGVSRGKTEKNSVQGGSRHLSINLRRRIRKERR